MTTEANSSEIDEIVQVEAQQIGEQALEDELLSALSSSATVSPTPVTVQLPTGCAVVEAPTPQSTLASANIDTKPQQQSQQLHYAHIDEIAHPNMHQQIISSPQSSSMMDESTGNGFTTAPATSEEDDDSDDDELDDSQSNYSNHNTNSNMSVMTNGSGSGRRSYGGRFSSSSSTGGYGSGIHVKGEEKRSHHNVLERKRRDLLKDSFARLRDSVPTTSPKERVSRAEILRQAADFIASTAQKNLKIRAELDELVKKNRDIEERRKAAGGGAGASSVVANATAVGPQSKESAESVIKQES